MDAPGDASTFTKGSVHASGASSIRLVGAAVRRRWPVRGSGHIAGASLKALRSGAGFPDPASLTVCPYSFSVLPTSSTAAGAAAGTR